MKKILLHIAEIFVISLVAVVLFVFMCCMVVTHGPSENAKRLFVLSCNETSALKGVPRIFLNDAEVDSILDGTSGIRAEVLDDTFMYFPEDGATAAPDENSSKEAAPESAPDSLYGDYDFLTITDVYGSSWRGKLMTISDPSKVILGTPDAYGANCCGLYMSEMLEKYGAVAGTNAGGFYDPDGYGNGGIPDGLVIYDGELMYGSPNTVYYNIIGFDADNRLHTGSMKASKALEEGLVWAVSFRPGPVLVKDGEMQTKLGGGINPRTCIGQKEDGTVLLLVIEGRKPDSLGASYDDIAQFMYSHGAVEAANLDGGSSSVMYYNGEQITRGSNIVGMRRLATAILIITD